MSRLIEYIERLTSLRDREQLDATLAEALMELAEADGVDLFVLVGDEGDRRWLERVRLRRGEAQALSGLTWVDLGAMAPASSAPQRLRCVQTGLADVQPPEPPEVCWLTRLALGAEPPYDSALEIRSAAPIEAEVRETVDMVVRIHQNMQVLLDYSERDTLTGLFNRKPFDDMFYKTLSATPLRSAEPAPPGAERRAARPPWCFWLAVADIDHFKRVNDQHGHLIGDEVLLLVGRLMRESLRFHDRLYRFGGEEFVLMLRCPDEAAALLALERFRTRMEAFPFPQAGRITASIGFTALQLGDSPSSAFERADEAVYFAKQAGRNQVISHAELSRRQLLQADRKSGDIELF